MASFCVILRGRDTVAGRDVVEEAVLRRGCGAEQVVKPWCLAAALAGLGWSKPTAQACKCTIYYKVQLQIAKIIIITISSRSTIHLDHNVMGNLFKQKKRYNINKE